MQSITQFSVDNIAKLPIRDRHKAIKHLLEFRGVSFSKIARDLGITHTTVLAVSNGRSRSKRVEAAIAGALDVAPSLLWPERYEGGYDG